MPYPAVFSRRDQIRSEIVNWFGDSADRLNIIAHGDLQYNMASVIRRENGVLFTLKLDLQHNGLYPCRFSRRSAPRRCSFGKRTVCSHR